jgi:hypothetical protein
MQRPAETGTPLTGRNSMSMFKRFLREEAGATAIEYG